MTIMVGVHILVCVFLVAVILIQPGKGDAGIGFGSSSQSIFGSRGAGNFLTKTTSVCAIVFLATSFFLTRARMKQYNDSVIAGDESAHQASVEGGKADEPKAEGAPSEAQKAESAPESK